MKRRLALTVLALALLTPVPASAQERPDFSGQWVLNLAKSTLATNGIEAGTVRIEHKEPDFAFERTFVTPDGRDSVRYTLATDGREKVTTEGGRTQRSRMYWDAQELVLDEKIEMSGRTATNVVRYRLENGGKTLVAHEIFTAPRFKHDNTWVFDRR